MDKLRKLGMGCPEKFEELLYFVGVAIAIVLCEKVIRATALVTNIFFNPNLHHLEDQGVWKTGNTIKPFPYRRARATGRHNQALHSPRIVLRQAEGDPPAHRVTQ